MHDKLQAIKDIDVEEIKRIYFKWDNERIGDESYIEWVCKLANALKSKIDEVLGEGEDERVL